MTLANHITKEPVLKIGIILPEDNQSHCRINVPSNQSKSLDIYINSGQLLVDGKKYSEFRITGSDSLSTGTALRVESIIAGRGFHWQKNISMAFPGSLLFRVVDDTLLVINEVLLEQYLSCVATSEMGADCPEALIQAQTIVARSFILANSEKKHESLGFDFCNDDCCQRYHGIDGLSDHSLSGSIVTRGQVPIYNNTICDTRYSKSCGGMIESFSAVWNAPNPSYFQVKRDILPDGGTKIDLSKGTQLVRWIEDPPTSFCSPDNIPEKSLIRYLGGVDEKGSYFRWDYSCDQSELVALVNTASGLSFSAILSMDIQKRGGSGRITRLTINGLDHNEHSIQLPLNSEYEIRRHLHKGFLYSSAFIMTTRGRKNDIPQSFHFRGAGWGHGAGLCQIGALGMALKGYLADDIIRHYYPGSKLVKLYE